MPLEDPITDDYVAEVLRRDAQRKDQSRYLSAGLGSLLGSSRPRSNAPKPNTRFLRNIVKEADSHNAALRRKEEEESKERMRGLKRDRSGRAKEQPDRDTGRDAERWRDKEQRHGTERRHETEGRKRRSKSRSRSPKREGHSHRSHRDSRHRRRSTDRDSHHRRRSKERGSHHRRRSSPHDEESESDPLETPIGPKPPPKIKTRGRGADSSSAMDSRFDPNYDPQMDVGLEQEEDGDDWDMALEALRDRAKWRKSGADRLRAAGFTDDEVAKWEKGGSGRDDGEKDISDVRWNKRGEGREWDRGKTMDGGRVDVKPEWGRLKD